MCAHCASKSGHYDLSQLCCSLRLLKTMKDPKAAAEVIAKARGREFLDELRKKWRSVNDKRTDNVV